MRRNVSWCLKFAIVLAVGLSTSCGGGKHNFPVSNSDATKAIDDVNSSPNASLLSANFTH